MFGWLLKFAARQSHEEVQRQVSASIRVESRRRLLALLPFAIATLFLPTWLCVALAILNSAAETSGLRLLGQANPALQPQRYLTALGLFCVSQALYSTIPTLIWQDPDGFAKSFAIGVYFVNLVHLATIRSVHLPLTFSSFFVASTIAIGGNSYFWITSDNMTGLAISTVCVGATTYFVIITMVSVHELYQEMFDGRRAAEAANDAKSRFLAQMSHELRTPLNAILGMGFAERTVARTPESHERLSTIVDSARNLSVLLNDILDLSAVQAGQLPIRATAVNLRAETDSALALFRLQLAESRMQLTLEVDPAVPHYARLDGQRYRQCLSNIVANAVKYVGQGTVSITITAPTPTGLEVLISDTGAGVPESLRDRIFDPFQRGDSQEAGTGLGLSISRILARRMGGDLILLPGGNGARFRLSLQFEPTLAAEEVPQQPQPLVDLRGKRVLVVDDIPTNRLVALTYLRIMGADPFEAADGATAMALLGQNRYDCILLDMLMPQMDGMTVLGHIRNLPTSIANTPVVAMTADATEERRQFYLANGLDGYISKPITPEALGAVILAAIDARRV